MYLRVHGVALLCALAAAWQSGGRDLSRGSALLRLVQAGKSAMKFELRSPSWQDQQDIPREFSCEGANVSPELEWSEPPAGTQAFALIMEDPDAPSGIFTHWVVYDLPGELRKLPQMCPRPRTCRAAGCKRATASARPVTAALVLRRAIRTATFSGCTL
jgi:Raf kinase inhibitor-like YbhB/YbcL family protein